MVLGEGKLLGMGLAFTVTPVHGVCEASLGSRSCVGGGGTIIAIIIRGHRGGQVREASKIEERLIFSTRVDFGNIFAGPVSTRWTET